MWYSDASYWDSQVKDEDERLADDFDVDLQAHYGLGIASTQLSNCISYNECVINFFLSLFRCFSNCLLVLSYNYSYSL